MREIKFRAWDKHRNCWNYTLFELDADGEMVQADWFDMCQFTGLQDKNGVDIYEGDIVTEGYNRKYGTFIVKWDKCGFNLNTGGDGSFCIIGNIYENKELIK